MMKLIFGEHLHCLNVNSGRMAGIPRNMRLCNICQDRQVEDLEHFILWCDQYTHIRQNLISEINKILPSFSGLNT